MQPFYVIGDLHGQYARVAHLLQAATLIDADLHWAAGDATLCFMGDFCDRGPQGIECVDLVMRLQHEAAAAGGQVTALMGNHEPLLLAAHRFGLQETEGPGGSFWGDWHYNGGQVSDLERLTPAHVEWLSNLPAMVQVADRLLMHADALFYIGYGRTIEEVNQHIGEILQSSNPADWDQLLVAFTERMAFINGQLFADGAINNIERAQIFLRIYTEHGRQNRLATQIIHGHTPIPYMTRQQPHQITAAHVYADGLCVNVDGGLYLGGPGFVHVVGGNQ
ncbi:MAG: metallophosphoesterase [Caldilineaceae bacterium]